MKSQQKFRRLGPPHSNWFVTSTFDEEYFHSFFFFTDNGHVGFLKVGLEVGRLGRHFAPVGAVVGMLDVAQDHLRFVGFGQLETEERGCYQYPSRANSWLLHALSRDGIVSFLN